MIKQLGCPSSDVEAGQGFAALGQVGSGALLRPHTTAVSLQQPPFKPSELLSGVGHRRTQR